MKHTHADLMLAYAQDAQESDTPWLLWEYKYLPNDGWLSLKNNPTWLYYVEYRRKVKTIRIGNYDVPAPLRVAPEKSKSYYFVEISYATLACVTTWINDTTDNFRLDSGICHLARESAELHAKALISLTEQ